MKVIKQQDDIFILQTYETKKTADGQDVQVEGRKKPIMLERLIARRDVINEQISIIEAYKAKNKTEEVGK